MVFWAAQGDPEFPQSVESGHLSSSAALVCPSVEHDRIVHRPAHDLLAEALRLFPDRLLERP